MLATERRFKILALLKEKQVISVTDLCELLEASEATIRRDLTVLEHEGKIERTHGGAMPSDVKYTYEERMHQKAVMNVDAKNQIAARAFEELEENDTIVLDAGTTTMALASLIGHSRIRLTVITNSTVVFSEIANNPNVEGIIIGGKVRNTTLASVGSMAIEMMKRFRVDKAFCGVNGITIDAGLTTADTEEAAIKHAMLTIARKRYLLADHSKFNKVFMSKIAPLSMIDTIITDYNTDQQILNQITNTEDINIIVSEDSQ